MPKTSGFTPLWPEKDYVNPMPSNAGDFGGTKGGMEAGSDSQKETEDSFGPKVTTVELAGAAARKGDKITDSTFDSSFASPAVRTPTKSVK
jgi:hypothetical protein